MHEFRNIWNDIEAIATQVIILKNHAESLPLCIKKDHVFRDIDLLKERFRELNSSVPTH